ncbi:hypothetical protein [Neobacillus sp. Marseille-QA0830]
MSIQELSEMIKLESSSFPEITEEQAMKAYIGALIEINDDIDAFYYFACMNLLNAFVKKDTAGAFLKRYQFKNYVAKGIEQVLSKKISRVFIDNDVVYISIIGLQFSFHNIPLSKPLKDYKISKQNTIQVWSGIRLQPAASLIFTYAEVLRTDKNYSYN